MKRYVYKVIELPEAKIAGQFSTYNFKPGRFWILPSLPGVVRVLYVDKELPNDD